MDLVSFADYLAHGAVGSFDYLTCLLSKQDLKALSLTSRTMRSLLFDSIFTGHDPLFISANTEDLEYFDFIVEHPDLRVRVRKLFWDDSTFDERILEQVYWEVEETIHPCNSPFIHNATGLVKLSEQRGKYDFWLRFVQEHLYNRATKRAATALKKAFRHGQLPNLKSITLTTLAFKPNPTSKYYPSFPPASTSPAVHSFQKKLGGAHFPYPHNRWNEEWLVTRGPILHEQTFDAMNEFHSFDGINAICEALVEVPHMILEEFSILPQDRHDDVHHAGLSHYFFRPWTSQLSTLEHVFPSLKHLTLSIGGPWNYFTEGISTTYARGWITRLVLSASSLESIWLDLDGASSAAMLLRSNSTTCPGATYVGDSQWGPPVANLKRITLTHADLTVDNLLELLRTYRSQLRYLRIEECHLNGSWRDLLNDVRDSPQHARLCKRLELEIDWASDNGGGLIYAPRIIFGCTERRPEVDRTALTKWLRRELAKFPLCRDASTPPRHLLE